MPWVLHAGPRAPSSTSPSGRTSFWPWNAGSSYSTQLRAQRPRVTEWGDDVPTRQGLWVAEGVSARHFSLGTSHCPHIPQVHTQDPARNSGLTSLVPPVWKPRGPSRKHQQCLPKPPCCCLGSQAPRRASSGEGTEGVLRPCPQIPHLLLPHPFAPHSLPFQAWCSVCPGSSMLSSGMESGDRSYGVASLLSPPTCHSRNPTSSLWPSTPKELAHKGCHTCSQPPGTFITLSLEAVPFPSFLDIKPFGIYSANLLFG